MEQSQRSRAPKIPPSCIVAASRSWNLTLSGSDSWAGQLLRPLGLSYARCWGLPSLWMEYLFNLTPAKQGACKGLPAQAVMPWQLKISELAHAGNRARTSGRHPKWEGSGTTCSGASALGLPEKSSNA